MKHYETLGLGKDASPREIKHAYRKLAHKHHPDREGGDTELFQAVQRAYEVLSDPEKRARYDKYGDDGENDQTDYEASAHMTLQNLFSLAIEQSSEARIKDFCISSLTGSLNGVKGMIRSAEASLAKLKRMRGVMRVKEGIENQFEVVLTKKITSLESEIAGMKSGERITERCLELLQDYDNTWVNPYDTGQPTFQLTRQW